MATIWVRTILLVVIYTGSAIAANFTLTLLHTNDVHAHFEQFNKYGSLCSNADATAGKCFGGFPRLTTAVRELRAQYPNSLLLDAGDQSQGTVWYTILKENITTHFMNVVKYDAMTLGNHEFDRGDRNTLYFMKSLNFTVLGTNVDQSMIPEAQKLLFPSVVFNIGGEKVAVVGYITTDTKDIAFPERFVFTDEVKSLQPEVNKLKSQGINKIIALGHSGINTDLKIAQQVSGVDVVIGGHDNTFLYNGDPMNGDLPYGPYPLNVTQPSGDKVAVVQDFMFAKYLGVLHVTFNEEGELIHWKGNPILLDSSFQEDPEVKEDLNSWREPVERTESQVLGVTMVELVKDTCFDQECNIGNMIADGMRNYFVGRGHPDTWCMVNAAVVNAGSIRNSIVGSTLTLSDILLIQPFQNNIDVVVMEGQHIRKMLEHSVGSQYQQGGFFQVSGIKFTFDLGLKAGNRLTEVLIQCNNCSVPRYYPLEDNKDYSIAASTFIIRGGDKYTQFKDYAKSRIVIGILDSDLLSAYVRKYSPLTTGVEGRITINNSTMIKTTTTISSLVNDCPCMNSQSMVSPVLLNIILTCALGYFNIEP